MEQNSAEVFEPCSAQDVNQHELEVASELVNVTNRLIKVEEDTIILFEKLEQITSNK